MKKVLAFAAFALIFAACNNVAKFKPMIEELASKWDSTTTSVADFANTVKTEQSNWLNAVNGMQVAPEAMAKWDEAAKTKYNEIQTAAQNSTTNLAGVASELDAFVTSWTEKGNEVKALQDGLAAGKLEGDVAAKIAELTAAATDATSKLGTWQTKFNEVKTAAASAQQMFADFMTTTTKGAATTGKK
jgi:hypothetical protein